MAAIIVTVLTGLALAAHFLGGHDGLIVLPFEMAGDDFQGLNRSLVGFMSNAIESRGLHVVAREGGPDDETPRTAAVRLGVSALVTGTLKPEGRRWRVTVRLVRVRDGQTIWHWVFDSPPSDDRQETQAFISELVAGGLSQYLNARPD